MDKWTVEPDADYWLIVDQHGRVIAEVYDHGMAVAISDLPQLLELRADWASIINRLACIARDGAQSSNDCDYAEEMLAMARPYLGHGGV